MRARAALVLVAGCARGPAPTHVEPAMPPHAHDLCITHGEVARTRDTLEIRGSTVRGVVPGSNPDVAALELTYRGPTAELTSLASGDVRSQVGLKLRAEDSCNLVYVMWRLAPTPAVTVQVKRNPGQARHEQCGTDGYTRVRAVEQHAPARVVRDSSHTLSATIEGDVLRVWADHELVWRGTLPANARGLHGQAGFRTDNVALDLAIHARQDATAAPCPHAP